jgi:Ternary complex associated domain 9
LRYTFIGEPGKLPVSLREALLATSDPSPVIKLFDTFGPNWWMQRKPHAFRVAEEYDRMLPAHYVLQRVDAPRQIAGVLDGSHAPAAEAFGIGDVVQLRNFGNVERRADGSGYSLTGSATPGQPPLRARFLTGLAQGGLAEPLYGRITATRDTLLRGFVDGFERYGLADPLLKLERVVNENIQGTQSTIHGDLNLENVLIGLGGIVWLIDFALTRDGHPLYDFAHLEADVIAHVIAPQIANPRDFMNLAQTAPQFESLRAAMRAMALRCLFNPSQPREYDIALYMACTGALKYSNLNAHQKRVLYLAAAQIAQRL